tara:strand:+ start:4425 stop:4919 length:495 start_codon:yes stop_codon:yes gene_type:complete
MKISFKYKERSLSIDGEVYKVTLDDEGNFELETSEEEYLLAQSTDIAEMLLFQIQDEYDHTILLHFHLGIEFRSETPYEIISDERESGPIRNCKTLYYSERATSFMIGRVDKDWDYKEVGQVDIKDGVSDKVLQDFEEKLNNYYNGRVYERFYKDGSVQVQVGN